MLQEIQFGLPIFVISLFSILTILFDAITKSNKQVVYSIALVGLILTGLSAAYTLTLPYIDFNNTNPEELTITFGSLTFGGYAAIFDIIFVTGAILTLFVSRNYLRREFEEYSEYYSLMIFAVNGMLLIAHSANLLMLFVGIELMSISFYVLAGFIRNKIGAVEAALKYFLLGAFATGFLVYGMAMIYGATGSFDLSTINQAILLGEVQTTYFAIGIGLLLVGLGFKVSAFPFHQWAPDVYSGAPTVVTAFMSTAGKAAAFAGFMVVSYNLMPFNFDFSSVAESETINSLKIIIAKSRDIIAYLAAATMIIGNITALMQSNVKRMLAYSSVAHAGYILMGIVSGNESGSTGIIFYSAAYMFMQVGSFIIVSVIERGMDKNLEISDYAGLHKKNPYMAALMAIFMFSLAGIPPFAGFPGKYLLFISAIETGYTWLTIVAVIATIISMYFYIGLIIQMYFKDNEENIPLADTKGAIITLAISTLAVLFLGIFPQYLIEYTKILF